MADDSEEDDDGSELRHRFVATSMLVNVVMVYGALVIMLRGKGVVFDLNEYLVGGVALVGLLVWLNTRIVRWFEGRIKERIEGRLKEQFRREIGQEIGQEFVRAVHAEERAERARDAALARERRLLAALEQHGFTWDGTRNELIRREDSDGGGHGPESTR